MRRHPSSRRTNWQFTNEQLGLIFDEQQDYWQEDAYYSFSSQEIDELEKAANAVQQMCIAAGDRIAESCQRSNQQSFEKCDSFCILSRIGVPDWAHAQIIRTWEDGDANTWQLPEQTPDFSPSVYGRFDFHYAGEGTTPKLLEYNAQTPTSLLEAAVIQWQWLEDTYNHDQWNSIHERLIAAWKRNMAALFQARPWLPDNVTVHFAYESSEETGEDYMNTAYMQETCRQAGYHTKILSMSEIGLDAGSGEVFYNGEKIHVIFALYPWEWLWKEEGGKPIFDDMADSSKRGTVWIEPPYKAAMLGNKALLPVIWELYKDDPILGKYLLPAYFNGEQPISMTSYAMKPIWGREGQSTLLIKDGKTLEVNTGIYGQEGYIIQELCPLPAFEGIEGVMHPVLGVWMIDGEAAGMGIRESAELITGNTSRFVPHIIN